jgi:hypothetical protein
MGSTPVLIQDHDSPQQDLAHALQDAHELFRAVLGEPSNYSGQARNLTGRVDCYKRGRDALVAAEQILHQGMGRSRAVQLPQERPTTEAQMKRQAQAGLRTARAVGSRHGITVDPSGKADLRRGSTRVRRRSR